MNTAPSTISSSSDSTWEEMRRAAPSAASWRTIPRSSSRERGSRPEAGSSSSSTRGRLTRARARPSRCFCPRESTRAGDCANSVRWTSSSSSTARIAASCGGTRYAAPNVVSTSVQVRVSHCPNTSGIQPITERARAPSVARGIPATRISPASGASRPASMSMRVVFPDPLGPTSAVTVPGSRAKLASATARTGPNARRTPRTSIADGGAGVCPCMC